MRLLVLKSSFLPFLCLAFSVQCLAEEQRHSVAGEVIFEESTRIYISLVNEETFKEPLFGIQGISIQPDSAQIERGKIRFVFSDVTPGIYGVRCFQDRNENVELDGGFFGPKEPWGMSWNNGKPRFIPKFKHMSFTVDADVSNLEITVKK